jgi:hypothetical protein
VNFLKASEPEKNTLDKPGVSWERGGTPKQTYKERLFNPIILDSFLYSFNK